MIGDSGRGAAGRAVRTMSRRRAERLGASEVSYRLYMAVMVAIIVVAPAVRVILLRLEATLPAAGAAPAAGLAAAATAVTAALVLAGSVGGPALPSLPQLDLLFASGLSRAALLAPRVLRAACAGALSGGALTALVVVARIMRGEADAAAQAGWIAEALIAGAGLGALGAMALLVGQLGRRVRAVVAGALALLAAAQLWSAFGPARWVLQDPWSVRDPWTVWAELLAGGPSGGLHEGDLGVVPLAAVPLAVGALLTACGPWIAARLRWETLRAQAARWDIVRVLAVTGDPSAALVRLGSPVRMGRRLRLRVRPGSRLAAILVRRDLLGIVRAPGRSLAALVVVAGSGALWMQALAPYPGGAPDLLRAALGGAAAFLACSLGAQPWCRGIATAAAGSASPPLLPASPAKQLAAHLIVPASLGVVLAAAGAAAVLGIAADAAAPIGDGSVPTDGGALGWAVASAALFGALAVLLRLVAVLKGPIPMKLLAPIPTPVGDAAGINVLLWTLDGPLSALVLGAILGPVWASGIAGSPLVALVVSALAAGLVLLWARARLGAESP